jgi:hypothetical protein
MITPLIYVSKNKENDIEIEIAIKVDIHFLCLAGEFLFSFFLASAPSSSGLF